MDLKNLGKTVARFAPLLGAILPIPGGAAIGQLIAHEFGGDINNPDDLASRIASDPNSETKLFEIQTNSKVQLQQLWVQNVQNELAAQTAQMESDRLDRADARKNSANSYMPSLITFIIVFGFFGACYLLLDGNTAKPDQQVLFMMLGSLSSAFGGAVAYWLGSSASSSNKDRAIHSTLVNLSNQS